MMICLCRYNLQINKSDGNAILIVIVGLPHTVISNAGVLIRFCSKGCLSDPVCLHKCVFHIFLFIHIYGLEIKTWTTMPLLQCQCFSSWLYREYVSFEVTEMDRFP